MTTEGHKINRRLTLVDGMVLLGAIAVSFALARHHDFYHTVMISPSLNYTWKTSPPFAEETTHYEVGQIEWGRASHDLTRWVHWCVWSGIVGASLAPAILILSLLPPRPRIRRVFRAPGSVSCVSATFALAISPLAFSFNSHLALAVRPGHWLFLWGLFAAYAAGFAVAASWLAMALGGRWRPAPTWLDRAGRLIGVYWISLAGFLVFLRLLKPLRKMMEAEGWRTIPIRPRNRTGTWRGISGRSC